MAYSSAEDKEVCVLNGDKPIDEVEVCNINEIMYKAESLVIEAGRRQNE